MSKLELIVEELKRLPEAKLDEAADYIHRLRIATQDERDAILHDTSGIWNPGDADAVERAITEGCERIHASDW